MSKQKMLAAKDLIQKKKYAEARKILKTVNHPTAQDWLAKLDKIAPEKKSGGRRTLTLLLGLVVMIALVVAAVLLVPRFLPGASGGGAGAGGAQAAAALARYFPADTILYASIRTDDAYLNTLDGLWSKIVGSLPPEMLQSGAPTSLKALLDNAAQQQFGGDFQTTVRAWLGGSAAVGMTQKGDVTHVLLAASITDKAKALEFVNKVIPQGVDKQQREQGNFTLLHVGSANNIAAVGADVIFLASDQALLPLNGDPNPNLNSSAPFNDTLKLLPASSYNAVLYTNAPALLKLRGISGSAFTRNPQAQPLIDATGPIALGATILDEHTLTLDIAQKAGNLETAKQAGFSLQGSGPVDPGFLANIPANAGLVVQGRDLKTVYDTLLTNAKAVAKQSGQDAALIDQQLAQVEQQLQALTGLKLQDDILSWLTGHYVAFASYTPPAPGTPFSPTSLEFGVVIEATDPAKAQKLVDSLGGVLTQFGASQGLNVKRETIGGANAVVAGLPLPNAPAPVEVVIAANNKLFIVGTRKAATDSLSGAGGFNNAPGFKAAAYLLPNATTIWYADSSLLILGGDASGPMAQNAVRSLANAFTTATGSTASTANGDSLARLTISLNPNAQAAQSNTVALATAAPSNPQLSAPDASQLPQTTNFNLSEAGGVALRYPANWVTSSEPGRLLIGSTQGALDDFRSKTVPKDNQVAGEVIFFTFAELGIRDIATAAQMLDVQGYILLPHQGVLRSQNPAQPLNIPNQDIGVLVGVVSLPDTGVEADFLLAARKTSSGHIMMRFLAPKGQMNQFENRLRDMLATLQNT